MKMAVNELQIVHKQNQYFCIVLIYIVKLQSWTQVWTLSLLLLECDKGCYGYLEVSELLNLQYI